MPVISQGMVAMHFRCGGMLKDCYMTHLLLSIVVKRL